MKKTPLLALAACLLCACGSPECPKGTGTPFSDPRNRATRTAQAHTTTAPRNPAPQLVYVGGEFRKPGAYAWTNGMSLKDAFAAAGGLTDFAWERITLRHGDGSTERFRWSERQPLTNNPALSPGDRVFNPRQ